jgi:hypothetical protein
MSSKIIQRLKRLVTNLPLNHGCDFIKYFKIKQGEKFLKRSFSTLHHNFYGLDPGQEKRPAELLPVSKNRPQKADNLDFQQIQA